MTHDLDVTSAVTSSQKHPEQAIYCQPYGIVTSLFIVMHCGFYYSRVDIRREMMDDDKELKIIIWLCDV